MLGSLLRTELALDLIFVLKKNFFLHRPFLSLYSVCYNIASVLYFGFLTVRHLVRVIYASQTHTPCIGK